MRCGTWSRFDHGAGPRRIGATDKLLEWHQNPAWFADLELHDRDGYAQPSALGSALQQATGPTLRITQHCALGSSISPVLANLFMHYAFDMWLAKRFPTVTFERYCDDAVIHCKSLEQARLVRDALAQRLSEVGLELHSDKTRIVYCQDADRRGMFEHTSFTFLGYVFRPRLELVRKSV